MDHIDGLDSRRAQLLVKVILEKCVPRYRRAHVDIKTLGKWKKLKVEDVEVRRRRPKGQCVNKPTITLISRLFTHNQQGK